MTSQAKQAVQVFGKLEEAVAALQAYAEERPPEARAMADEFVRRVQASLGSPNA